MKKYFCNPCGYTYDPEKGDPEHGIKPGTAFEDLPADWCCPLCGVSKDMFQPCIDRMITKAAASQMIQYLRSGGSFATHFAGKLPNTLPSLIITLMPVSMRIAVMAMMILFPVICLPLMRTGLYPVAQFSHRHSMTVFYSNILIIL